MPVVDTFTSATMSGRAVGSGPKPGGPIGATTQRHVSCSMVLLSALYLMFRTLNKSWVGIGAWAFIVLTSLSMVYVVVVSFGFLCKFSMLDVCCYGGRGVD